MSEEYSKGLTSLGPYHRQSTYYTLYGGYGGCDGIWDLLSRSGTTQAPFQDYSRFKVPTYNQLNFKHINHTHFLLSTLSPISNI